MPKEPAAFPKTVVAMSALVIWKFMPRALTTKINAMMMRMSVRLCTYTTDSRSWPGARGTRVRGYSWSPRMRASAMTGAMNMTASMRNTGPIPHQSMKKPAEAGPIRRAV